MNGAELRGWRTSRGLYQRDVVKLLADAGVEAIDQPTVSEWERGIEPVPADVDAILANAGADIPVTQEPTPAAPARRPRRGKPDPVAAEPEPEPAPDEPEPADADPQPAGTPADDDVRPRPVAPRAGAIRAPEWSPAVRSQLEKDLTTLLAGSTFIVPVPVQMPNGEVVEHHEEAFVPGIAQLVGFVDEFDGRVVAMNAPQMAHAWAELANESPKVRGILLALTYGGAWRGVIAATLPVVYSIGVHHGLIPPVLGGAGAAPPRAMPEPDGVTA